MMRTLPSSTQVPPRSSTVARPPGSPKRTESRAMAGSPVRVPRSPLQQQSPSEINIAQNEGRRKNIRKVRSIKNGGQASPRPRSEYGNSTFQPIPCPRSPSMATIGRIDNSRTQEIPSPLPRDDTQLSVVRPLVPPSRLPPCPGPRNAASVKGRIVQNSLPIPAPRFVPPRAATSTKGHLSASQNSGLRLPPFPPGAAHGSLPPPLSSKGSESNAKIPAQLPPLPPRSPAEVPCPPERRASAVDLTKHRASPLRASTIKKSHSSRMISSTLRRKRKTSYYKSSSSVQPSSSEDLDVSKACVYGVLKELKDEVYEHAVQVRSLDEALHAVETDEKVFATLLRLHGVLESGVHPLLFKALLSLDHKELVSHVYEEMARDPSSTARCYSDALSSLSMWCYPPQTETQLNFLKVVQHNGCYLVSLLSKHEGAVRSNIIATMSCVRMLSSAYLPSLTPDSSDTSHCEESRKHRHATVAVLVDLLQHKSSDTREAAIAGIMGLGPIAADSVDIMIHCLQQDKVPSVRALAARAFRDIGMPVCQRAIEPLKEAATKDKEDCVRRAAQTTLTCLTCHPNAKNGDHSMDDDVNEYRDGNVMVTEDMLRQAIIATDPHRLTATVSQLATYIRANSVIDVRVTEARLRTHIKLTLKRMSESGGLQRAPATYSLTS